AKILTVIEQKKPTSFDWEEIGFFLFLRCIRYIRYTFLVNIITLIRSNYIVVKGIQLLLVQSIIHRLPNDKN
ncbi:hypothetical protein V7037_22790, partial [Priestia megaterium]|uniref:hypothetical protein n=1 Tax=Priestia megaterium TaxID=1404 RepID=UPI002FFF2756